jgi:chromosome segregation ATPase
MANLPSIPTDSLYKFIALFGLVLFGFGVWYPEKMFRAADADMREALKVQDLDRIKVERKKAEVDRIMEQLKAKSAELAAQRKLLDAAKEQLDSKGRALSEEAARMLETNAARKGEVSSIKRRSESFVADAKVEAEKVRAHTDRLNKLTEEYDALLPRQNEVVDALASANVIAKASSQALESLTAQARSWFYMQNGSVIVGCVLIILGFVTWYFRVQRYQDAILRKQAGQSST